jgi:hypothetical protein
LNFFYFSSHKLPKQQSTSFWSQGIFGVKPPKRGIQLGWVTRRTRPKKPSSSRGFAREARGARVSWGLKTENRTSFPATNNFFLIFNLFVYFFRASAWTQLPVRVGQARGYRGRAREGEGMEMSSSVRTGLCPRGRACVRADAYFTIDADGKNPSANKNASAR